MLFSVFQVFRNSFIFCFYFFTGKIRDKNITHSKVPIFQVPKYVCSWNDWIQNINNEYSYIIKIISRSYSSILHYHTTSFEMNQLFITKCFNFSIYYWLHFYSFYCIAILSDKYFNVILTKELFIKYSLVIMGDIFKLVIGKKLILCIYCKY